MNNHSIYIHHKDRIVDVTADKPDKFSVSVKVLSELTAGEQRRGIEYIRNHLVFDKAMTVFEFGDECSRVASDFVKDEMNKL